jgi:hypothetical protein
MTTKPNPALTRIFALALLFLIVWYALTNILPQYIHIPPSVVAMPYWHLVVVGVAARLGVMLLFRRPLFLLDDTNSK